MSGLPAPSAAASVWPRLGGPSPAGPTPFGGGYPSGLPVVANPNLPSSTFPNIGNYPPPVPQAPTTPFPNIRQPLAGTNSINSTNYGLPQSFPPYNSFATSLVPNPAQAVQQAANQRRLTQLEGENAQRRAATTTLQQVGTHLLQDQMFVQEQVLQYQFMLEQCLETLDHQNLVLNGQAEELALLRAKLRTFENFMDMIKQNQENNQLGINTSPDAKYMDGSSLCSRNLLRTLNAQPGSPFSRGGVTRVTSSKFQPFNPRYRSPTGRSSNPNESHNVPPRPARSIPNFPN